MNLQRAQRARARVAVPAALTAAVAIMLSAPVAQAAPGGAPVLPVNATFHGQNLIPADPACAVQAATDDSGEIYFSGIEHFSGSWEGDATYCAHGHFEADGFHFKAKQYFTGIIHGCGVGSVTLSEEGIAGLYDEEEGGFPVDADWQVDPGSASAGLARLRSGSGLFDYVLKTDHSFEDGKMTGSVRCIPPERP